MPPLISSVRSTGMPAIGTSASMPATRVVTISILAVPISTRLTVAVMLGTETTGTVSTTDVTITSALPYPRIAHISACATALTVATTEALAPEVQLASPAGKTNATATTAPTMATGKTMSATLTVATTAVPKPTTLTAPAIKGAI